MTSLDPQASGNRIAELDALRGVAVIGIVLMNIYAFAMPAQAYYNPVAWGGDGWLDRALWAASFVLVEDKFRNLFAMMFGAGVAIMWDRGGEHRARGHYARMAVLFVIGFLHALVLSSSDVLRLYAICGLVLPLVLQWKARTLWAAVVALLALHMAIGGWVAWGWLEYWWQVQSVAGVDPGPLRATEAAFGADPVAIAQSLEVGRESLGDRIDRRIDNLAGPLLALGGVLPTTLAAMLAGIALWRNGLLASQWERARLFAIARTIVLVSVPPLVALAWFAVWSGYAGVVIAVNAFVWSAPFDLLLGIGWAALVMAAMQKALSVRLAAVGRMALTNYLVTSMVLAVLFRSWGLGLFATVGRVEAYLFAAIPIALMLAWSPLWLGHFRHGPAEWLWRSLAQARFLPLCR